VGYPQKVLALGEDRPTPGEILSVESQKRSLQIPAGHVREGQSPARSCEGDGSKPLIEEAMDRNRKTETGSPKPETMNATIRTGCCVGGVSGIGFGHQVRTPRLGSASIPENAGASGRCHKDFHRPKAASAVIPSLIIL